MALPSRWKYTKMHSIYLEYYTGHFLASNIKYQPYVSDFLCIIAQSQTFNYILHYDDFKGIVDKFGKADILNRVYDIITSLTKSILSAQEPQDEEEISYADKELKSATIILYVYLAKQECHKLFNHLPIIDLYLQLKYRLVVSI
jgi:hypothetical protein